jgi:hypothetical protein
MIGDGEGRVVAGASSAGKVYRFPAADPFPGGAAPEELASGPGLGRQVIVGQGLSGAYVVAISASQVVILEGAATRACAFDPDPAAAETVLSVAAGATDQIFVGYEAGGHGYLVRMILSAQVDGASCTIDGLIHDLAVRPERIGAGHLDTVEGTDVVAVEEDVGLQLMLNGGTVKATVTPPIEAPDGSSYGQALLVADVIEGNGVDEILVGSPDATTGNVELAGRVDLYVWVTTEDKLLREVGLTVARPEMNERFGRALAAPRFVGRAPKTILAVGAARAIYLYYRLTSEDTDPR